MNTKRKQRGIRHTRVTRKLRKSGSGLPRLVVFRSNKFTYAQIIDDKESKTLVAFTDAQIKSEKGTTKLEKARKVGENLAKLAEKKNVKKVVFDRAGYKFHGRVKAVAEGAREGGLVF